MVSPLAFRSKINRDDNTTNPPGTFGVQVRSNKLRKRPSQTHLKNCETINTTTRVTPSTTITANQIRDEMGNHLSSFENIPRPFRPPRPTPPTRLPSLPCLPIYETFTVAPIEAAMRQEKQAAAKAAAAQRTTTTTTNSTCRAQRNTIEESPARINPGENPPTYDRALQLADAYRAILPNYDAMEQEQEQQQQKQENDGHNHALLLQRPESKQQNQSRPHHHSHVRFHTSSSSCCSTKEVRRNPLCPSGGGRKQNKATPGLLPSLKELEDDDHGLPSPSTEPSQQRKQQPTTTTAPSVDSSSSSSSSSTAVDSNVNATEEPSSQRQQSGSEQQPIAALPTTLNTSGVQLLPFPSPPDCTGASVALQYCSRLLVDELTKVLLTTIREDRSNKTSSHVNRAAAKLQVLMMIEAYEGMLEHWKDEISSDRARSEEEDDDKAKYARDAVDILSHWLASLRAVYQDQFGDKEENL
ncbi:hypothetical protein QBC43DRAFT_283265 [Cladorrhinum sp. PSN259]|nr:hypothetical protein QBC43DRAFT_283265 [Cladorrhinum sp. PSN259]